jgi:hypothetical protein
VQRGNKERVKEGERGGSILYSCMKIKQQNCFKGGVKEIEGGANLIKMYFKHLCKCHNVSPVQQ